MKVLIATDTFKGSLTSYEAGVAISEGIHKALPSAEVVVRKIADGGEGTYEVVTSALGGTVRDISVTGPLGGSIGAHYGMAGSTAVMDISKACGLPLVPLEKRDPMHTTTYGVGEMIRDALDRGCRKFIIGIGGSSTNDCGAGMLQALGVKILDNDGKPVRPGAAGLADACSVDQSGLDTRIRDSEFLIACDVNNPLTGSSGCSMVFAPQKGADIDCCRMMDEYIVHFASLTDGDSSFPGAGAAGGLGFAFRSFLNGELKPGAELLIEQTGLDELMNGADIVITGEGCLDSQTSMGKVPSVVAKHAKSHGARVLAFAGCVKAEERELAAMGIDEAYAISDNVTNEESMRNAAALLAQKAYEVFDGRSV